MSSNSRFEFFERNSAALNELFVELKSNTGLFLDGNVQTKILDCTVKAANDLIENVNLMKEVVTSPSFQLGKFQPRYNQLVQSSQATTRELVAVLKRYIPRATTHSPILGIDLSGSPSTISNAVAGWYNSERGTLAVFQRDLGVTLPNRVGDSLSYFAGMVKDYIAESQDENPDFGRLIRSILHILMFIRAYVVPKIGGDNLNSLVLSLNELSTGFVHLIAAKLRYENQQSFEIHNKLMGQLKNISAILKNI